MNLTLSDFITQSKETLDQKRERLEEELKKEILEFIDENVLVRTNIKNATVQGRVKGTTSLAEKIVRKRYADRYNNDPEKFVSELPDLIGLRIICLLHEEEESIFSSIKGVFSDPVDEKYYSIKELKGSTKNLLVDHSDQPETQSNKKMIYRLSCKWITESSEEIFVELQIKSLVNMFWSEIEHMLFYKNYAYMVGSHFYEEVMNTIYKTLITVDSQLQLMSSHLSIKSQEEQFFEMKQMLAKLMYNMFSTNYKQELIDIEVDLREIYDLMVQIEFRGISTLSKAQSVMNGLITKIYTNHKFTRGIFVFDSYNMGESILNDERKKLGTGLDELSKSNDIFWKAFIGLYKMFQNKETHTEVIDALANDLMSFYSGFDAIFEMDDEVKPAKSIIKKGIEKGIIHIFLYYRKLDFFIINGHQQVAFLELHKYVKIVKDRFLSLSLEELHQHGEGNVINVLTAAFSLKIALTIEKKIGIEYLKELYNLLKDQEISGLLFDVDKLKVIVDEAKDIRSDSDVLENLFVLEKRGEEE